MKPIAIVGISALFPGSKGMDEFWKNILSKKDLITDIPPSHWLINDYYSDDPTAPDKTYSKRGGFIPPTDFDPLLFGVPPNTIPVIDSSQLLSLIVAKQVMDDASANQSKPIDLNRMSIILGVTGGQGQLEYTSSRLQQPIWRKTLEKHGIPNDQVTAICNNIANHYTKFEENTLPGSLGSIVAGRIANRFNLGGTNCTSDAACASTLSAINIAIQELELNKADLVITGGVDTVSNIGMYVLFCKTTALSLTDDCRPFDKSADGTILGEGLGFFILKRLDDAERDGDKIYAVIRGMGCSSDGRAKSIYAPVMEGQVKAITRAYEAAGYSPSSVELVEAHGTGTKTGDVVEFEALKTAFANGGDQRKQQCALGSVKSQIGHTKAAAGAASLIKVVMGLHHKILPPMIKVTEPNPELNLNDSPFYINSEPRPWIHNPLHPRRAAVSSFGFGGTNYHLTVEEYHSRGALKIPFWSEQLFLFSAENVDALIRVCKKTLETIGQDQFIYAAMQSQTSYQMELPIRLSLVVTDARHLHEKLKQILQHLHSDPSVPLAMQSGCYYSFIPQKPNKIAFLFPGFGSQYIGMGSDLAMAFNCVRQIWDECADLEFAEKQKLHDVVFPIPTFDLPSKHKQTACLNQKHWAQPAISLTSLALYSLLEKVNIKADCFAGRDVGVLTAQQVVGLINKVDLLKLLHSETDLETSVQELAENSSLPRIYNLKDCEAMIATMYQDGIDIFVEVGPGNALTQLVQQNLQQKTIHSVHMDQQNANGITQFWHALAKLFVAGVNPAMKGLWSDFRVNKAESNQKHANFHLKLTGTTYGKPYPSEAENQHLQPLKNQPNTAPTHPLKHPVKLKEDKSMNSPIDESKAMPTLFSGDHAEWMQLVQVLQKQTAESHNIFQTSMTESHMAFLKMSENLILQFVNATVIGETKKVRDSASTHGAELISEKIIDLASAKPVVADTIKKEVLPSTNSHIAYNSQLATELVSESQPHYSEVSHVQTEDDVKKFTDLLLEIIADKTGYPTEMLSLTMSLESDLGIDSIKRVEILTTLQESLPNLPEVDQTKLISIQTIGDIVSLISQDQAEAIDSKKK